MNNKPSITDTKVLESVKTSLVEALPMECASYQCQSSFLYKILLGAVVEATTIETVCRELVDAPVGTTIRGYLNEQLTVEQLPHLEKGFNQALVSQLPKRLQHKQLVLAMDIYFMTAKNSQLSCQQSDF